MNEKLEFVTWKLEETVKKREELEEKHKLKRDEYLQAKEKFESLEIKEEIEQKKNVLLTLQEQHKKELDELKSRHKKERDKALSEYTEVKDNKKNTLKTLNDEFSEINKELEKTIAECKDLHRDKHKLKGLSEVSLTSHAIVQYLDRAKNWDVEKYRNKVRKKIVSEGSKIKLTTKIQDHQLVDYLVEEEIIELNEIEKEIIPEDIRKLILSGELIGGTGTFTIKSGFRLAVSGGKVVTFLPKKEKEKKKSSGIFKREKRVIKRMKL